ncbi:MAG: response regulator [Sphaerobacteraceae bacterium]|nr:MAG: response regulator [Sphaerobacteraceae bacterium]
MADDDDDDRMFAREALSENRLANDLHFVGDGEELMDYLLHQGNYADPATSPRPRLILLDLNMPNMDGREALEAIKAEPGLRQIPVVVLTTSTAEADIFASYDLGASSYITKPVTFDGLVNAMRQLGQYWFEIVDLPGGESSGT